MKKRLFSVLLATAMVASMATGATCTTVSAAEKKTIKFFHRFPDEPFNSFIEDKIAQYEEEHPDIDIVVESAQNDPYKEKLKVVLAEMTARIFSLAGVENLQNVLFVKI